MQELFHFQSSFKMQLTFAVPALLAARFVAAIDFTDYDPQPGVQPEFKAFLNA